MFDYELFKRMVLKDIEKFLPENYKDRGVNIMPVSVNKVNGNRDGIVVKLDDLAYAPTVYLDMFYDMYRKKGNFYEIMDELGTTVADAFKNVNADMRMAMDDVVSNSLNDKGKIYFEVINSDYNSGLLSEVPHRKIANTDLSIVYRYMVSDDAEGRMSTLITNDIVSRMLQMTEPELYDIAKTNTRNMWPIQCQPLYEAIKENYSDFIDDDIDINMEQESALSNSIYIITNTGKLGGAVAIEYSDALDMVSEIFASQGNSGDYYILPSSRHEILCVPVDPGDVKEQIMYFEEMVASVNIESVALEDRLSFNVYKYDSGLKEVMQMTNSSRKLDDRRLMQHEKKRCY